MGLLPRQGRKDEPHLRQRPSLPVGDLAQQRSKDFRRRRRRVAVLEDSPDRRVPDRMADVPLRDHAIGIPKTVQRCADQGPAALVLGFGCFILEFDLTKFPPA